MSRGGIGVGSSSIVLVFAVLCLTVFSLITYVVAGNDRALIDNESRLVIGFFEADALAEQIVAEILESNSVPENIHGIEVRSRWDWYSDVTVVEFAAPISDVLSIYVRMMLLEDSYDIASWRMINSHDWEYDAGLNIWPGPPGIELDDPIFG